MDGSESGQMGLENNNWAYVDVCLSWTMWNHAKINDFTTLNMLWTGSNICDPKFVTSNLSLKLFQPQNLFELSHCGDSINDSKLSPWMWSLDIWSPLTTFVYIKVLDVNCSGKQAENKQKRRALRKSFKVPPNN